MVTFLLRRLGQGVAVMLLVSVVVFVLINLTGDPAALLLPPDASVEHIQEFRRLMGLDRPLPVQYLSFLGRAVQGDFGESLRWRQPALGLVLERVPATLELTAMAMVMTLALALPLGILSAVWRDSLFDRLSLVLALLGQSIPAFWLGAMLILLLGVQWPIFPMMGGGGLAHLVLPGFTLAAFSVAMTARLLRASLLDVLNTDYIRTAHGKGLRPAIVLVRHALKNAAAPVVTVVGLQLGTLLGGIVVVEYVFGYPGMGRLLFQAVGYKDVPVVQAVVVFMALLIVLISFGVDLAYVYLDPRMRHE